MHEMLHDCMVLLVNVVLTSCQHLSQIKMPMSSAFLTIQYIFIMIITIDFINAVAFYFYIIFETYSEKLSLKYK